jgi:CRP-like cAMP-binding protein
MVDAGAVKRALASSRLFADLPDEAFDLVLNGSRVKRFRRGQVIFSTGDASDSLLVVVSGRITATVRGADGGELMLAIVGAGGVLGELGVIDGGPRSADAETLDDSEVLLIPRETVQDLRNAHPRFTDAVLSAIAGEFRRLTDATADLVFLELPRRVAKVLLDHPRSADGKIELGLSQEQLSHRVAGTRQSVNQALRGFERRGWISINGRAIVVRDVEALSRFAGDMS